MNAVFTTVYRAEEMALWVKCSLYKPEDQSSNPLHSRKIQAWLYMPAAILAFRQLRQEDSEFGISVGYLAKTLSKNLKRKKNSTGNLHSREVYPNDKPLG